MQLMNGFKNPSSLHPDKDQSQLEKGLTEAAAMKRKMAMTTTATDPPMSTIRNSYHYHQSQLLTAALPLFATGNTP